MAGHRWKSLLTAIACAVAMVVVPFVIFPNISATNYWWTLRVAAGHGLEWRNFKNVVSWDLQLLIPVAAVVMLARLQNPAAAAKKFDETKYFAGAILAAFAMVLPFASKYGAGPHHLLPLVISLLWYVAEWAPLIIAWMGERNWQPLALQALLFSWATGCLLVGMARSYQDGSWLRGETAWANDVNADLDAILAKYDAQYVVLMGAGENAGYTLTFFRTHLVFAGQPDGIEPGPLMELTVGENYAPNYAQTISAMEQTQPGKKVLWLVPKGQAPFTMASYYTQGRPDGDGKNQLFDAQFVKDFTADCHKIDATRYYDLYAARS